MINKLSGWDDTIVALATAPGTAAIAVIRLSGKSTFKIIDGLFPSKKISEQPSHTIHYGILQDEGKVLDEVLLSLFKAPKSYTGEDVVEISCHGSPFVQQQIIKACIRNGARLAKAGEFTQRAFLNSKMDLAQAEAVADLIASDSAAAQRTALNNIRGGFSNDLKAMREQLIQFAALIELELDFSTEDVEFADREKFKDLINNIEATVQALAESFRLGNVIKNGVSVAIIGKPNAGKSTLLNSLLNENRAIVSEIPGTTRDTIEEIINIKGVHFRLIDTAGIRAHSTDTIELIGIERSLEKMRSADLVLYIFDVHTELKSQLETETRLFKEAEIKYLLVGNKAEVPGYETEFNEMDVFFISAMNNIGIEILKTAIFKTTVDSDIFSENTIITNSRHYEALQQMLQSVREIKEALEQQTPGDLMAADIRRCLYFLGEITGEITNEDKLDYIFSKFCIGK